MLVSERRDTCTASTRHHAFSFDHPTLIELIKCLGLGPERGGACSANRALKDNNGSKKQQDNKSACSCATSQGARGVGGVGVGVGG